MDAKNLVMVRISKNAEAALQRMVGTTNDGFTGGQINRVELISWILIQFESRYLTECLEQLRHDHFDPVTYLESMVKQVKEARATGGEMPDLRKLLSPLAGKGSKGQTATRSPEKVPAAVEKDPTSPKKLVGVKAQPLAGPTEQAGDQGQK